MERRSIPLPMSVLPRREKSTGRRNTLDSDLTRWNGIDMEGHARYRPFVATEASIDVTSTARPTGGPIRHGREWSRQAPLTAANERLEKIICHPRRLHRTARGGHGLFHARPADSARCRISFSLSGTISRTISTSRVNASSRSVSGCPASQSDSSRAITAPQLFRFMARRGHELERVRRRTQRFKFGPYLAHCASQRKRPRMSPGPRSPK